MFFRTSLCQSRNLFSVGQRRGSSLTPPQKILTKTTWWKSEESINLESCYDIFDETPASDDSDKQKKSESSHKKGKEKHGTLKNGNGVSLDKNYHFEEHKVYKELSVNINRLPWYRKWFYRAVELFGLDIFLDLRYVSIMIGTIYLIFCVYWKSLHLLTRFRLELAIVWSVAELYRNNRQ